MEPEDVSRAMQVANQTEQIRQSSIKSLFDSMNTMAAINRSEQAGDLDVAQAERLRRRLPGEIETDAAQAYQLRQHGNLYGVTADRIRELKDAEVKNLLAEGRLKDAQAANQYWNIEEGKALLPSKIAEYSSLQNYRNAQAAVINATKDLTVEKLRAERDNAVKKAGSWTKMKDANGQEVDVAIDDYVRMLDIEIRNRELGVNRDTATQEKNLTRIDAARKQNELDQRESEEAESQLNLHADKGVAVTQPLADKFNRLSPKDYIYVPAPTGWGGKALYKLAIPEVTGEGGKKYKLRAKDVTALAKEKNVSPEVYLDQLYTDLKMKKVYK